jgi:hypothetical protein
MQGRLGLAYSSVRGVIFFSSTSSSAKVFWYFSQLEPVADGMLTAEAVGDRVLAAWVAECLRGWRRWFHNEASVVSDKVERGCGCGGDGLVGVDEAIRGVGASGSLGTSALWLENNRVASSSTKTPRHPSRYPSFFLVIPYNTQWQPM